MGFFGLPVLSMSKNKAKPDSFFGFSIRAVTRVIFFGILIYSYCHHTLLNTTLFYPLLSGCWFDFASVKLAIPACSVPGVPGA
mgnify:CR=1 FL=1